MKVVINRCFGGFGLSDAAYERLIALRLKYPAIDEDTAMSWGNRYYADWHKESTRSDPLLVQVVEEMGKGANGQSADLKVVEIPDDVSFTISDYDGYETIHETHRTWG